MSDAGRTLLAADYRDAMTMTHERSNLAGMTDYTGVSLEDIVLHFNRWKSTTEQTIVDLRRYLEKAKQQSEILENPDEVISFLQYFIDLFSRYLNDIGRLVREIPKGVTAANIEIVQQLYRSSKLEEGVTIRFKQNWVHKHLLHEEARPLLDKIYGDTRDQLIDYRDLSNVMPRLRTFVGSGSASPEVLQDFHLKPNLFGIGVNLNRIFGRTRDWWHRWRK
jgi:hypothetical protein